MQKIEMSWVDFYNSQMKDPVNWDSLVNWTSGDESVRAKRRTSDMWSD